MPDLPGTAIPPESLERRPGRDDPAEPIFTECDRRWNGEPHRSRALVARPYFDHAATVVVCTARSRRGKVCGREYLVFGRCR